MQGLHIPPNSINNIMLPDECTVYPLVCVCVRTIHKHARRSTKVCPCSEPDSITLYRDMEDGGFPFNMLSIVKWRDRPWGHSEMQTSAQVPGHLSDTSVMFHSEDGQCHCCPYE